MFRYFIEKNKTHMFSLTPRNASTETELYFEQFRIHSQCNRQIVDISPHRFPWWSMDSTVGRCVSFVFWNWSASCMPIDLCDLGNFSIPIISFDLLGRGTNCKRNFPWSHNWGHSGNCHPHLCFLQPTESSDSGFIVNVLQRPRLVSLIISDCLY